MLNRQAPLGVAECHADCAALVHPPMLGFSGCAHPYILARPTKNQIALSEDRTADLARDLQVARLQAELIPGIKLHRDTAHTWDERAGCQAFVSERLRGGMRPAKQPD